MAYGSGLSASLGIATESVVGTEVVPAAAAWYELLDHSMTQVPTFLDSMGLKAGQAFKRVARTQISKYDVNGDISMEFFDRGVSAVGGKGMGYILRHALGSPVTVPTQMAATTAYKQNHVPGSKVGLSFTTQVGSPQTDGTIKPFTYRGCKILSTEFSVSDGQLVQVKFTVDGWRERATTSPALISPVFAGTAYQAGIFSFADAAVFTLGGTATTAAGETTVAGGVSLLTVFKNMTLTINTPLAVDRYGLGNAGVKREQIENAIPTITGKLGGEFTSQSEIYDIFAANTTTVIDLAFQHGLAGTAIPYELRFTLPAVKFKTGKINLNGADILSQDIEFEGFDDGSGTNPPIQVRYVSQDQAL